MTIYIGDSETNSNLLQALAAAGLQFETRDTIAISCDHPEQLTALIAVLTATNVPIHYEDSGSGQPPEPAAPKKPRVPRKKKDTQPLPDPEPAEFTRLRPGAVFQVDTGPHAGERLTSDDVTTSLRSGYIQVGEQITNVKTGKRYHTIIKKGEMHLSLQQMQQVQP